MTKNEFNLNYWMFYIQLENDFYETLNYVEFSSNNFDTYSKEYAKQLVSIGSELDILFKALCEQVDSTKSSRNITEYAKILCDYNDLKNAEIVFGYDKGIYKPFDGWEPTNSPSWWTAYNNVKHHRAENDNMKNANLENVFNALAALFILNRYLCKEICSGKIMKEPEIKSKLFEMVGWEICIPRGNGFVERIRPDGGVDIVWEED